MKTLILTSTLFLSAAVMSVQAQSIRATIPFAFEANGKSMPAGDYRMDRASQLNGGLYTMKTEHGGTSVLLPIKQNIADSAGPVKLVFQQRADGYYLTELWDGDAGRTVASPHGRNSVVAATRVVVLAHK